MGKTWLELNELLNENSCVFKEIIFDSFFIVNCNDELLQKISGHFPERLVVLRQHLGEQSCLELRLPEGLLFSV